MSRVWFTSDIHFGHQKILEYCPNRPYSTLAEHDAAITREWQEKVAPEDHIYFLGDLTLAGDPFIVLHILDQLPGNIHLVLGNHDRALRKVRRWVTEGVGDERMAEYDSLLTRVAFMQRDDEVEGMYRFRRDGRSVLMTHHPVEDWPGRAGHGRAPTAEDPLSGRWHLHGHSHGNSRRMPARLDVGWDTENSILSWERVQELMVERCAAR